jgi:hypothetical protein
MESIILKVIKKVVSQSKLMDGMEPRGPDGKQWGSRHNYRYQCPGKNLHMNRFSRPVKFKN